MPKRYTRRWFGMLLHHVTLNTGQVAEHRLVTKSSGFGPEVSFDTVQALADRGMDKLLSNQLVPVGTLLGESSSDLNAYAVRSSTELGTNTPIFLVYGYPGSLGK